MLEKIARDICLIKYRKFPLRDFEKDEEISFCPKIYSHNWYELEHKSNAELIKLLSTEFPKLYENLNVENLIFFGDYNRNWISKFTEEREDYKPLIDSVDYFKHHKVGKRFNGAVKVSIAELSEFVKHFFVLTMCDGGFAYYHFLDEKENLLGFIHYSGVVRFDILNQKMEKMFVQEIKKTKFILKE
ncbi:hypothetical protein D3C85_1096900 [compost metagenome]